MATRIADGITFAAIIGSFVLCVLGREWATLTWVVATGVWYLTARKAQGWA